MLFTSTFLLALNDQRFNAGYPTFGTDYTVHIYRQIFGKKDVE
jgi:hypothetical protein